MSQGEHPTDPDRAANERLGAAIAELRQGAWGDLRHIAHGLEVPLAQLLGMVESKKRPGT